MKRLRLIVLVALAWFPFAVLWALFVLTYAPEATIADAVESAVREFGTAAVLGVGVWWLSGVYAWPARLRPGFYLAHVGFGVLFSAAWNLIGYGIDAARMGRPLWAALTESRTLGWEFLQGFILYGLVAGVSYALRIGSRLREQEAAAARAESRALEARMRALKAQLHPHFLFNCLHSLGYLIRSDPQVAEDAVERLGGLLRYSLDETHDDAVTLAEEWAFTRDYLELERLRLNGRLRVEIDLQEEALAEPVPPLVLQPLVENAVRHAIDPRPEGGRIRIIAGVTPDTLTLRVEDDGPGPQEGDGDGLGLGLQGLRDRLLARYGPAGRVSVLDPREGFAVVVSIPRGSP